MGTFLKCEKQLNKQQHTTRPSSLQIPNWFDRFCLGFPETVWAVRRRLNSCVSFFLSFLLFNPNPLLKTSPRLLHLFRRKLWFCCEAPEMFKDYKTLPDSRNTWHERIRRRLLNWMEMTHRCLFISFSRVVEVIQREKLNESERTR